VPPERRVDPEPVALAHQLVAEARPHAEQHLELVVVLTEGALGDQALPLLEKPFVVRRDPDVAATLEQLLERLHEARLDCFEIAEGDLRRLEIDPLADPYVRPQLGESAHVVDRPLQPCLEDDADVVVPRLPQLAVDPKRVVGRGRVLHVDPDEVVALSRVPDDVLEVLAKELVAQVQPECGRLDADVRVERTALEGVDRLAVCTGDRAGLLRVGDLLAEHVQRRELALRVQLEHDS